MCIRDSLSGTSGTGGTIIAERQTSSNGTFVLTGLDAGTYVIEEISAPNGYVMSDNDIQTVYLSGANQDVITVTFGNEALGSLLIKKIDSVTRKPLADVEFMVTYSDGTVVGNSNGKFTTDSAGTILIEGLAPNVDVYKRQHVDYKKLKSSKSILHEPAWKSSKRAIPLEEIPELKAMHDSKSERKPKRKSSKDEPTMLIEADGSVTLGKRVDDINSKV